MKLVLVLSICTALAVGREYFFCYCQCNPIRQHFANFATFIFQVPFQFWLLNKYSSNPVTSIAFDILMVIYCTFGGILELLLCFFNFSGSSVCHQFLQHFILQYVRLISNMSTEHRSQFCTCCSSTYSSKYMLY